MKVSNDAFSTTALLCVLSMMFITADPIACQKKLLKICPIMYFLLSEEYRVRLVIYQSKSSWYFAYPHAIIVKVRRCSQLTVCLSKYIFMYMYIYISTSIYYESIHICIYLFMYI